VGKPPRDWYASLPEDWLKAVSRPVRHARVDPSVPNAARVWDYMTGGHDNFEADRSAARQLLALSPVMAQVAPASRAFLRRAVTYLAAEAGIRQFLDIGTGMPAEASTHSVAQRIDPSCRVVYLDNDPVVIAHARAALRSSAAGGTSCVAADARDTRAVLDGASQALDLTKPVAVIMVMVLHFLEDAAGPLTRLTAALAPGSHLAVTHPDRDERAAMVARRWNQLGSVRAVLRDRAELRRLLDGLQVIEPGIVEVPQWRPAPGDRAYPEGMPLLGAVARKP
jgi:O-methyltransferase involved in polyketide biosynthesis